jgi:ABC-2 type transport system permease protein
MTGIIARKEFTEMLRDGRVKWCGGVILALLAMAFLAGWARHEDLSRQHRMAKEATRQHWLTQGKKNPHSAAHYGIYAFKPKLAMSVLDTGTEPYTGVAVWLEAHKQNEFKYRPAQDATMLARFGELTAASVLQLLVPLLIVIMTFSTFAGEKEQGTLRQLLSLGVPPRQLAAGKALGLLTGMALYLVPAALLGSAALVLSSESGAAMESLPRALWLALAYLLYFLAFAGVGLAISAWVKSPRLALVALLGFWIFNCLVAPRAAVDLSKRLHPTPSAFEFAQTMARDLAGGDGHSTSAERDAQLRAKVLKQYGVAKIENLPVSYAGISMQAGEEHGNVVFDQRYGELWSVFGRQNEVRSWSAILAPMLAIRPVSMGMAGTDSAQHRHFAVAAEEYRRELNRRMNDELRDHGKGKDFGHLVGDEFWKEMPDFSYTAPGVDWVLANQAQPLTILAIWAIAGIAACYFATTRLKAE